MRASEITASGIKTAYKPKKCAACSNSFTPTKGLQKVCNWRCGLDWIAQQREKRIRKDIKAKLKTRSDWVREAQQAINAYVRARDIDLPCISCGRHHEGQWHAGHFRSTAAAPQLRFDERNLHKQCQPCNAHLSGNLLKYRPALIAKLGMEVVEALEADNAPAKWTIEDLKQIKATYKQKLKELKQ